MYISSETIEGMTIEIDKYCYNRYSNPPKVRGKRLNPTPDKVKKVNQKNSAKQFRIIVNSNFRKGDIHIVLKYPKGKKPTPEQACKYLEKFLRKLRKYFKDRNKVFKYVAVTEYYEKAIHHHLIISSIDPRKLINLWEYGSMFTEPLYSNGDFYKLAGYLVKETSLTYMLPDGASKKRWNGSKNLIHPKPTVKKVKYNEWRKEPQTRDGYMIITDSIREGVCEVTGYMYQSYRMVKIE